METQSHTFRRRKILHKNDIILFAFLLLAIVPSADALFECTSAIWGEWGNWSKCPAGATGADPTLVAKRSRSCNKSPLLCFTSISCDGQMSETLVCGTTTTRERYSTIVFGTTAIGVETTTFGDETTTIATTELSTVDSTTLVTTTESATTTGGADTTSTAISASVTSTVESTVESTSPDGSVTASQSITSTESLSSAANPTDDNPLSSTLPAQASTDSSTDCSSPVTELPTSLNGATRSPACRTTPNETTTIEFTSCTMIPVSSTAQMDSTTADSVSSPASLGASSEEPSASSVEPSGSSESPSASSESPSGSSESPSGSSEEPSGSSESPSGSSESPSGSSESPSGSSESPSGSSESPSGSSESPSGSSESPSGSSDSPSGSSEEPSGSSEEPSGSSEEPSGSSEEPSGSSESPSGSSEEPSGSSESPSGSSESPSGSSEEPSGSSESPSGSSEEPSGSSDMPSGSSESPSGSSDSPSGSSQSSSGSSDSPSGSSESPIDFSSESPSGSSESPSGSSDSPSGSSDSPSGSSESPVDFSSESPSDFSSESPSDFSSEDPSASSGSPEAEQNTTPLVLITESTTETPWTTCNDCSQVNVQLFNGSPYEDASSVLNRYSASGCYYVQFFCRPIQIGDTTPVSTILSGNTSYLSAPLSANLACRDKKWLLLGSSSPLAKSVTSVGCAYAAPTTTTRKPTTLPGVDPNNPCMNCSNLVVSQSIYSEGVTYLDHTFDKCLSVEAHCVPINGGTRVELMYNNKGTLASGSTVNRTFTCTKNSKWLDVSTNNIISNISCVMPEVADTDTTPFVGSTVEDIPSTDSDYSTKDSSEPASDLPEDQTTPSGLLTSVESQLSTSGNIDFSTVENVPSTVDTFLSTEGTDATSAVTTNDDDNPVTFLPAICNNCVDLEPLALTKKGYDNGMLALWHYRREGCYRVSVSCQATTGVAALYYNSNWEVKNGAGAQTMDLVCNNGSYIYSGKSVTTASCLATTGAVTPITTAAPIVTPEPTDDCSGCNRLPVVLLSTSSSPYANGLLKATTVYSDCMSVQLTCYGVSSAVPVALVYADAALGMGTGNTNLTLTCNAAGTWVTSGLQTVESISCGYIPQAVTAAPTACSTCPTLTQTLVAQDTPDGVTEFYYYLDSNNCKKVDISCHGIEFAKNATIIFNQKDQIATGTTYIPKVTLNCSADGKWKYQDSIVDSASCMISTPSEVVITPAPIQTSTTTLNPSIPLCAQCARLSPTTVSSIDNSLLNGVTKMSFSTVNSCLTVNVTCSGTSPSERVTILAATTSLVSGVGSVSFNFNCNAGASWMTAAGTILDSIGCGKYNVSTSSLPPVTAISTITPTTTAASQCSKCANLMAKALNPSDGTYDGMIVLNHYTDASGCRKVEVSCGPTLNTENATIIFGNTVVATGASTHSFTLTCNPSANWVYESTSVSTVSCSISSASNGVTVAPSTSTTRQAVDNLVSACRQCGIAPIVSVGSGSTYLNGFTTVVRSSDATDCSVLKITCQGSTSADAVALLSSGMPLSSSYGSISSNLTCNSQSQWTTRTGAVVTSLACGHKNAATTASTITTLAPSGQCASCPNMAATTMTNVNANSYDGLVVMDHFVDPKTGCRSVTVTCAPTVSTENATLYFDTNVIATGMASHEFSLTCNPTAQWTYDGTVVSSVGCLISTGTGQAASTVTTAAPVTNPANNLCSQCPRLSIQSVSNSSSFANGFSTLTTTTNTFGCLTVNMMCQGLTSTDSVAMLVNGNYADMGFGNVNYTNFACNSQGQWTSTNFGIVKSVICQRKVDTVVVTTAPITTQTTTASSLCNSCPDVTPIAKGTGDYYDGMLVINHYRDRATSCLKASIECMPTMDYETSELWLNSQMVNTGSGVGVNMDCSSSGSWVYDGKSYSTSSCLVANSSSVLPASGKKRKKRQAGTGLSPCQSCTQIPLISTNSFYPYRNGFATIDIDDSSTCMTAIAKCEGTTANDNVAWIASGTVLASGSNSVQMNFTCNSLSSWQTSIGLVFSSLSCGRQVSTAPTTTAATQVLNCSNLVAAPLSANELGSNESNGQLILDHFVNTTLHAREVSITCYGNSATDNTTISFNGGSRTLSGTGQISLTMVCDANGQWMRNGAGVQTVACIVVAPPGSTIPLTTTIATTPTTSAGSSPNTNCARSVMLTIPSGYNAGYLSMNTVSTETSLQLVMSCAAPTGIPESMLLSSDGSISTTHSPTTNMTLNCNSLSQWVVSSASGSGIALGSVITTIACVVAIPTTTPLVPATVPAGCQHCLNLPAIGLEPNQLEANERNGQFILDHVSSPNACRVAYLSCAGSSASENSTILFNGGSETMSNPGITYTTITCSSTSTWDWYGSSISYASCKVADRALSTVTANPLTTPAYEVPGETGLACSRSSLVSPLINGDAGAYLVLDTNVVNEGLSTTMSCAAPDHSATAVLTNGDGSVLGTSSNGLINMTLTCNSNSQWVLSAISASTTGASAALGTVIDDMKCGEIAAITTTAIPISTSTAYNGACRNCANMQPLALPSSLLVTGATNGQLLLSHTVDPLTQCKVVTIKCAGVNTNQNATLFLNTDGQSLSAMYGQVSDSLTCTPSNTWQKNGAQITGVQCMITSVIGDTSTPAAPITTLPPASTTQSAAGPSASCSTAFSNRVSASGYTSGFMTIDTKTVGSTMTAFVSCATPVASQTATILDSNNNKLSGGTGSVNLTLTCNANSQWVAPSGAVISSLSCATVADATTLAPAASSSTSSPAASPGDCSAAAWSSWQEWSTCSDDCGSCGTRERVRSCNKPLDSCTCSGSSNETENCNLAVCKYPRTSCCTGFTPRSSGGTFVCMP